jgi:hypothetical protein
MEEKVNTGDVSGLNKGKTRTTKNSPDPPAGGGTVFNIK